MRSASPDEKLTQKAREVPGAGTGRANDLFIAESDLSCYSISILYAGSIPAGNAPWDIANDVTLQMKASSQAGLDPLLASAMA
jgi:hypothetical protein